MYSKKRSSTHKFIVRSIESASPKNWTRRIGLKKNLNGTLPWLVRPSGRKNSATGLKPLARATCKKRKKAATKPDIEAKNENEIAKRRSRKPISSQSFEKTNSGKSEKNRKKPIRRQSVEKPKVMNPNSKWWNRSNRSKFKKSSKKIGDRTYLQIKYN